MNIRETIASNNFAILSTNSVRHAGFPFGSIVPYDVDPKGDFVIYISYIAEHYKNLSKSNQGSLTIFDPFSTNKPQASWRVTALCEFNPVNESDVEQYKEKYESRFPGSINPSIANDFLFFKCVPKTLRWIEGFGGMGWLKGESYKEQELNPISYYSPSILEHLNLDHKVALEKLVIASNPEMSTHVNPETSYLAVKVNSESLVVRVQTPSKAYDVDVSFPTTASSPDQLRELLIEMLK